MTDVKRLKEKQREVALAVPEQVHNPNCDSVNEEQLPYPTLARVVFLCLKQTTRPRNWCLKITDNTWLVFVSMLMVLLNCVTLGMYTPCEENSVSLEVLEAFFFAFFMVEMLIKMVAKGVFGYEGSYLSDNWNKFDFFINCGEVMDYLLAFCGIHLQVCQALRPMRLIIREKSLRDLVTILVGTVPMLANVLILYMFFIHVFAVVGVQLWAGQLRNRCFLGEDIPKEYNVSLSPFYTSHRDDKIPFICSLDGMLRCREVPPYNEGGKICSLAPPIGSLNQLVPTVASASANNCINWNVYYNVCHSGGQNPHMGAVSFDNIAFAWIAIFQVITLEGWIEIMFQIMDAYSFWSFIFFILVTVMGSFIIMNVCAVVIATQFSANKGRKTREHCAGTVSITELYRMLICWLRESFRRYRHRKQVPLTGRNDSLLVQVWVPFRRRIKRIVKSHLFDWVIMSAVFLSILTMVIEHHEEPMVLIQVLKISNIIFTVVFLVEMIFKLMAFSWTYFGDWNNIFDFGVVIISMWEIIGNADGRLSVLRVFRLLRFVRLIHFLPYLERQLLVLKRTIKEAAPFCTLLLFATFVFSILGMHLFGGKCGVKKDNANQRKHFDCLLWSMVTVFQLLTQEDWNLVLYATVDTTSPWAALYFVTVIMFGKHVLLNVLVGIVVQSFQDKSISKTINDGTTSLSDSMDSTVNTSRPDEVPASIDTNVDNKSLNWIQKRLSWFKEHEDWAFYMLSPHNRFRICCQRLISHKMFDNTILLFILLSCVTIAMERPGLDQESTEAWILNISGYVFSLVFLVEMVCKVVALGLLFGKDSYCRSSWNVVDGLLMILSLVHIFVSLASATENHMLGILKVLRLLRTLRPLRVIKRAPRLKLAVKALIASLKPIGNIILISCAFFFFYGILGVQLFRGKFYYCDGENIQNISSKADCLSDNYHWVRKVYNFDNLLQALLSLFVMYSKDGWINIMNDGLDAVEVDKQPVRNHNEWMLLFFISFMIMSFFLLDMFVGVMVETFHQCQQAQRAKEGLLSEEGELQLTEPEEIPYYTHYSPTRRSIHTLCTSNFLDLFMTAIIVMSVFMMAFEHYNQPPYIRDLTEYSYYVFTVILIIEVLLKLVAFGALRFMKNSWNLLDVAVVLISIISIILNKMKMALTIPINPSILRVCRVLRLAQVLKANNIQVLLKTVIKTLSQVGNICLLFAFFFFIYAALGVELFGKLEFKDDDMCLGLHRYANFKNFGLALLALYQICTGDNWSGIMKDTLKECAAGNESCSTYLSWVSPIYFVSFVVMAQFVLVNLVVAAIMQALKDCKEETSTDACLPLEEEEEQQNDEQVESNRSSSSRQFSTDRPSQPDIDSI